MEEIKETLTNTNSYPGLNIVSYLHEFEYTKKELVKETKTHSENQETNYLLPLPVNITAFSVHLETTA